MYEISCDHIPVKGENIFRICSFRSHFRDDAQGIVLISFSLLLLRYFLMAFSPKV